MEPEINSVNNTGLVRGVLGRRQTWEQAEGSPLPLGVTWIEEEQAFNFAVHAEHAESVTLLLYAPGTWSIRYWRTVSIFFATSQAESGTAASPSAKLVTLVITDIQSRA